MPLTEVAIRNAVSGERPVRLFDAGGLYVEVSPTGSKLWRWKYRFAGKEKRLALGTYPGIRLKDARERRDEARDLLLRCVDPGEHRKALKAATTESSANSFEVVAREWAGRQASVWVGSTYKRTLRRFELDVFPWIGARALESVTAQEVLAALRRIEQRGVHETAHRVMGICGQVFRYGVATGRCARDITVDLRGELTPVRGKHFAATTEPDRFADILRAFAGYVGSPVVRGALQLAPLVFARPGELRSAEWAHINMDTAEWRYVVSKTSTPHIVPLSRQAMAVLQELRPLTGTGRFVFPSARSADRPMSDNAVLAAMRRLGIAREEMSGHGFRAVARTILDEILGVRVDLIEHQLAHAVRDPNGRAYNRTAHLPERRIMMQQWADYLEQLVRGSDEIGEQ